MRLVLAWTLAVLLVTGVAGCGDDVEEIPAGETGTTETKEQGETPAPADTDGRLTFALPSGWTQVQGRSQMRYATVRIPTVEGDTGKASTGRGGRRNAECIPRPERRLIFILSASSLRKGQH